MSGTGNLFACFPDHSFALNSNSSRDENVIRKLGRSWLDIVKSKTLRNGKAKRDNQVDRENR